MIETRTVNEGAITATIISSLWYLQVHLGSVRRWENGGLVFFFNVLRPRAEISILNAFKGNFTSS